MTEKYGDKYRVHDWMKFNYSEIGEYVDENHTDRPLRNDEVVNKLNEQDKRIKELENELELYRHYVEFVPSSGDVE